MKHSLQHGHFAAWSVLFLVIGLAPLYPDLALGTNMPVFGGPGGEYKRVDCPQGSYLVGLHGRFGAWLDQIAPVCAPWLRGSQSFGKPSIGETLGGTSEGGQENTNSCENSAIQSWTTYHHRMPKGFVKLIKAYCMSLASPPAYPSYLFYGQQPSARPAEDEPLTPLPFEGLPPNQACPPGEAAVGIHGRTGLFVDAIGLICGPLPARLSAPVTKVIPGTKAPPSPAATKANPLVKGPTDDMFTITKPAWNDRVQQGNLIVAAKQPKIGMTPVTELEFKWLDAPKNQPYVNKFPVDTPKLLQVQGYSVTQQVTRGNAGRWEVRARISGKTPPGPWSFPVQFHLFLTQPTQSKQQAPKPMQQAPLPSSSVVQPPSQGSSPATQMIPPPTTPSQGSSGFSGMIRRRGVEGDEGTTTGDQTPAEQKP